jgi:PadR family transcriptional regulator, regulatory protein PadR
MQEPTFLVLTALLDQPQHGYALRQEVQRIAEGRVALRVGTLYAVLERLAAEGLVEVSAEEIVNNRLRRTYQLTSLGADALGAETDRLESLARAARTRMVRRSSAVRPAGA